MYLTKYEEREREGDHRSEAVDDSCECCRQFADSPEGEQRERDAVQKQRQYEEMTPRCPIVGKRRPGDQRDNDQRDGTKARVGKGYVDRGERPKPQLDKPERAAHQIAPSGKEGHLPGSSSHVPY